MCGVRCVPGAAVMQAVSMGDGVNVKTVGRYDGFNVKSAGTRPEILCDGVNVQHDTGSVFGL